MANKINASFPVNAGGAWVYTDYVYNVTGAGLTQAATSTISRLITNKSTGAETTDSITVATSLYDTAQTNTAIRADTYNFLDIVPATKVTTRVRHTVQYTFTLANGTVIKTDEVDVEGD